MSGQHQTIYLRDYQPYPFHLHQVDLDFELSDTRTLVTNKMVFSAKQENADLVLDHGALTIESIHIGDKLLKAKDYQYNDESLVFPKKILPDDEFTLTIVTYINPQANTALEGLYRSRTMFCTQCEAKGFRRITPFPDRPDVMSIYNVRLIGKDDGSTPILLSNGNLLEAGHLPDGRPFARWQDPFAKPCYLFALVAGDLACVSDNFTTMSGRVVDLKIYVEHGQEKRSLYALDSLKRSMRWDEQRFGREYDLDLFMIVAVSDFNMGAMENKGLNIFNSNCVLADPETATDSDYEAVEAVVAHEYFHNWTGNRITCRDWFQLCLKEGLTVFRDQEFSADQRNRAVKRLDDIQTLQAVQFPEDAGPLSHPVRPESYIEMNNFYTATVYEKGAELCRMLHTLLGEEGFRAGMDLYFQRHDGQAVTVEDFLQALADANHTDLTQFLLWYRQAGTPVLRAEVKYNIAGRCYELTLSQSVPDTPGQTQKKPHMIPVRCGFLNEQGQHVAVSLDGQTSREHVLVLKEARETFYFRNCPETVVPSLLRGFSAPVNLEIDLSETQMYRLMEYDTDFYNRWHYAQKLARILILDKYQESCEDGILQARCYTYSNAILTMLDGGQDLEPAFMAYLSDLPLLVNLIQGLQDVDPGKLYKARLWLRQILGQKLLPIWQKIYQDLTSDQPFKPSAEQAGRRALRNRALSYIALADEPECASRLIADHYQASQSMTDRMAAMVAACDVNAACKSDLLADFYQRFENDQLTLDKWFSLQARNANLQGVKEVTELLEHPAFCWKNPNRVRSVLGVFAHANWVHFHNIDGSGYEFIARSVIQLNKSNPQIAARLATAFKSWRLMTKAHQKQAEKALKSILAVGTALSPDVYEIISKIRSTH